LRPLEKLTYRVLGVDPAKEQGWKQYTFAMLMFSLVSCLFTYAILRLQQYLPLNPQKFGALSPHLAFNTAVSFTTNTNWQSYGGESTMSYLSQMVALAIHNFFSAAVGIAIAAALVRGIARHTATDHRQLLGGPDAHHLLPAAAHLPRVRGVLVSQGMIQNFKPYTTAKLIEPQNRFRPKKTDANGVANRWWTPRAIRSW
jgi:potassium-transporting ATPase potassium-binding subunit